MAATIALIGNPNCGKTTIFNGLTGANQRVGNWPGVTVERKEGRYRDRDITVQVVDLPGVYALDAEDSTGLDEQIARKFLLAGEYDLVVNILDAANLERNFYLTSQLLDLGVPLILVLNMMDVARATKIKMDIPALSQRLGLPRCLFVPNNNSILLNCGKLFALPWQHHLFLALVCPNPL